MAWNVTRKKYATDRTRKVLDADIGAVVARGPSLLKVEKDVKRVRLLHEKALYKPKWR